MLQEMADLVVCRVRELASEEIINTMRVLDIVRGEVDRTVEFLGQQGRMKYLRPLYRALSRQPGAREAAVAAFKGNRAAYHPIAAKMVAADLGLDRGGGGADE